MLNNIMLFTQLVEIGSFSKTAEILKISPATLTRKIQNLEDSLNKQLLVRDTRNIKLTKEGSLVYLKFKNVKEELDGLHGLLHGASVKRPGILTVILPIELSYHLISPFLVHFTNNHPDIKLNIYYEFSPNELGDREVDIIVTRDSISHPEFVGRLVSTEYIQLYCSPEYANKKTLPLTIDEINNHKIVGLSHSIKKKPIEYIKFVNKFTKEQFLWGNFKNSELISNMGMQNLQIGSSGEYLITTWEFLCDQLVKQGKLIQVLPEWHAYEQEFYLYCHHEISPVCQLFINFIEMCMKRSFKS
ncbi:MAG: LysR family transcriptional regulator [Burkholderiales bacterium]|nr:LysR family transcriptional regulator [Burkholderiales bacterium]